MFGGGGTSTVTQNSSPWTGQQGYLSSLYNAAGSLSGLGPNGGTGDYPQYYTGQQVAPINNQQAGALWSQYDTDLGGGTPTYQAGQNYETNTLNGDYLGTNPGSADVSSMANGSLVNANAPGFQTVVNNTLASVMPSVESAFAGGGRMNSGDAASAAAQGAANAVGNLEYGNYNTQLQNQLAAAGLTSQNYQAEANNQQVAGLMSPQYEAQTNSDYNNAMNLGNTEQQNTQQNINAAMNEWNYNQMLPWNVASMYGDLISGSPGSASTTTEPYYSNTGANVLGTAAGLTGIASGANSLLGGGTSLMDMLGLSSLL